jgi:protoheme IX farnesyltransferase
MSETVFANSTELGAEARDWITLLKPRVLSLVVYTGVIGLIVAPVHMNPVLAITAILCITIAAGAASAINMWYDRDIDAIMKRTASRPIPAGRITPNAALGYGIFLSCFSIVLMALATNLVAAFILAISIGFYVFIYTMWLKRRTPQNIVIGGAAGAFPAVIGWAAATGSISLLPILLFIIAFVWTPPHFWSLALYASGDYERAGVPMLPVVKGARHTRWNVFVYTLILVASSLAPCAFGLMGWIYGITAGILGVMFIYYAWGVVADKQDATGISLTKDAPAKAAFKFSILYLFILFGACAVDRLI